MPSSYPPVLGGLQTVAHTLAEHLVRRGHAIQVLTNRYPRSLPPQSVQGGVPVRRWLFLAPQAGQVRRGRLDLFLTSLVSYPWTAGRLSRLVQAFQPEVVNVHFPDAQIPYVLRLRRRFRFGLVVSLHGHEVERYLGGGPAARQLRAIMREADAVTACSRDLMEKAVGLEPAAGAKGTVIYNGIDPGRFLDRTPYGHPRPYVLAFGRLTHKKGFDLLLEAFARLEPGQRPVDLIIAGDGEERPALEARARRLGLDGRVYWFGRASLGEIVQLLNGCLFVAVPSRAEPFGIVALEALAAGKPVLATRVGGLCEVLTQLGGCPASPGPGRSVLLVEPSAEGLAGGLRDWLSPRREEGPPLTLSAAVLADYCWTKVVARYEEVLAA
jgi:glycosyltransferase involved in cell wall biosynthesis